MITLQLLRGTVTYIHNLRFYMHYVIQFEGKTYWCLLLVYLKTLNADMIGRGGRVVKVPDSPLEGP